MSLNEHENMTTDMNGSVEELCSRADGEPRVRTLLREMIAALDEGDEQGFFKCFEWLQGIVLKMLEPENTQALATPRITP